MIYIQYLHRAYAPVLKLSTRRIRAMMMIASLSLSTWACSDDDGNNQQEPTPQEPGDQDDGGEPTEGNLDNLRSVLETNADIALAAYTDSVSTAEALATAINTLTSTPTEENFTAAKAAWRAAREPYGQTEVYRFRLSPIDDTDYDGSNGEDGPEGAINAWPLGEALIDYVVLGSDFGDDQIGITDHETGVESPNTVDDNIISDTNITIDEALISNSATADDERDVISGYHAIEFLLWGQDLNSDGSADTQQSRDDSPGQRPYTDYIQGEECTSGPDSADSIICERRAQFLTVVAAKLVEDLTSVRDAWAEDGDYRTTFTTVETLEEGNTRLLEILTGMGTLSEGELAGERMQIALSADSQEDEHSCFSDNTHRDIWLNAEGVSNSFRGIYAGYDSDGDGEDDVTDSAIVDGYGIDDYLNDLGREDLVADVEEALQATATAYQTIDENARNGSPIDVAIMDVTGEAAEAIIQAIQSLNLQSAQIARLAVELGIGSADDVVDPDASECDTTDPTTEC